MNVVNAQDTATDIAKNPLTSTATGLNPLMGTNPIATVHALTCAIFCA